MEVFLCKRDTTPITIERRPLALISDQEQIRLLIEAEGQAAVQKDIFRHVSLFTKDALFRSLVAIGLDCDTLQTEMSSSSDTPASCTSEKRFST